MQRLVLFLAWLGSLAFGSATLHATPRADAVVAPDGSGQYTSVQAAISAAPMNTDPARPRWVILVKPGTYQERVYVQRERGRIHVIGEDPERTVIAYNLHANLPGPDGKPIGTFRTPTLQVDGDGMIWENLTIANTAGAVGQALALRVDGDRVEFRRCRFLGWQDTILVNRGRHYFADCYVEGHVDFIFGGATAYFDRCRIHCVGDGYITAASTPKDTTHGFVFAGCSITAAPGVKTYLGRPWREFAKTVFLNTSMSAEVRAEGWHNWAKPGAEKTTFYAESASTGPGAVTGTRVPWAKALTAEDAALYTPANVLGGPDGWNPTAEPGMPGTGAGPAPVATASLPRRPAAGPQAAGRIRVILVGDSTVTDQSGWGAGFRRLLGPDIDCVNTAVGGRSSKSFRAEGHWDLALALKGDFYLIQFGHNDQPGKGADRETDPDTTFPANLARYVDEVRAMGATPVLITSLVRRTFDPAHPTRLADTLAPYAEATRRVAAEKKVPLVDLHRRSLELCESWGAERCDALNPKAERGPDRTHLDAHGSLVFAELVADELGRAVPALSPHLRSRAL